MLKNKKGIELSLNNILGLVVVALILVALYALLGDIINLLLGKADMETSSNFDRLSTELTNLKQGQVIVVPYYIGSSYKLTSSDEDKDCLSGCVCLCTVGDNGCQKHTYSKQCYGTPVRIENGKVTNAGIIQLLNLSRSDSAIYINGSVAGPCDTGDYATCLRLTNCALYTGSCNYCSNLNSCGDYSYWVGSGAENLALYQKQQCESNKCGLQNVDCHWLTSASQCVDCNILDCSSAKKQDDCSVCSKCRWVENACTTITALTR